MKRIALIAAAGLVLAAVVGFPAIERWQVRAGLVDAGLSDRNAACMARRLVDRLTVRQLLKLRALKGEQRSLGEYVAAVRKVGDARVLGVTASSAVLCEVGIG